MSRISTSTSKAAVQLSPTLRSSGIAGFSIAEAGVAKTKVIIANGCTAAVKAAATDLSRVLSKMTGASFQVEVGSGMEGIVVGTVYDFPHASLAAALEVKNGFEGRESFAIRTAPGMRVLILGASDLGASNGVYRFLRELGCRWLWPSPTWEVVPFMPDLFWSMDITDRPQILSRSLWYKTEYDFEADKTPWGTTPTADLALWKRRNLHNDGLGTNAGHNYHNIIIANKAAFETHPEYWPLQNGQRVMNLEKPAHGQIELGNPAVRQMFLEYARNYFRTKPSATMVSIGPNDGGGWSQSSESAALGSISDQAYSIANEVAKMLQQEFPGKMVGMYAYRECGMPPSFKLEPNVYVLLTTNVQTNLRNDDFVALWASKHQNLGFYDYYGPYYWHYDQPPGGNVCSSKYLNKRIRFEVENGGTAVSGESAGGLALFGPGHYAAAHMMWDASLDADALKADFLQHAFGPAADAMHLFYEACNPDRKHVVTKGLLHTMAVHLGEAVTIALGNEPVLARLRDMMHYMRYLELDWRLREMRNKPYEEKKAAFVSLFNHLWRIRYTYAIHWGLAAQGLWQRRAELVGIVAVKDGVKTLVAPEMVINNTVNNPWRRGGPITPEETAANFDSSLAYFETGQALIAQFSDDVVPVRWTAGQYPSGGVSSKVNTLLTVQSVTACIIAYSFAGEPINASITAGTANGKQVTRDWWVTDANGEVLVTGQVGPQVPAAPVSITFEVPSPGAFYIYASDVGGYLTLQVHASHKASIRIPEDSKLAQKPLYNKRFFYVPKGTTKLQFLYSYIEGATIKLVAPGERVVYTGVSNPSDYVTVNVPADLDGKVWRIDTTGIHQLLFMNAPLLMAQHPNRLLVPRELAENDGLTIITAP